jgi:hypothetical protein
MVLLQEFSFITARRTGLAEGGEEQDASDWLFISPLNGSFYRPQSRQQNFSPIF